MFKALLVVAATALLAQAQSGTTTAPASQTSVAGLDSCIIGCVTAAATTGGCSSYTDLTCVCTSTTFQQAALSCLQANCTQADVNAAIQLEQTECAALSSGASAASTATGASAASSGASTTHASTGTSTSSTSTSKSGAMALSAPVSFGAVVGTLVASVGALVGAAFVL